MSGNRFVQTRQAHRRESAEDFTEAVLELAGKSGQTRVKDIAAHLGIAEPTVSRALKKWVTEGLVHQQRYGGVSLTEPGYELAMSCRRRHQIVVDFLLRLGVNRQDAEHDAEGIEHHVSLATLDAMKRYLAAE